jgi:hypothetical protein
MIAILEDHFKEIGKDVGEAANETGNEVEETEADEELELEDLDSALPGETETKTEDLSPSDTLLPLASPVPVVPVDLPSLSIPLHTTESSESMQATAGSVQSVPLSEQDKEWIEKMVEEKLEKALEKLSIGGKVGAVGVKKVGSVVVKSVVNGMWV